MKAGFFDGLERRDGSDAGNPSNFQHLSYLTGI